ncbi:hypothetical protein Cob_v004189 [Colletotrichum orbiculare MAFF 240422]|uniref:Uncharacterized protein n=1 Tax=Colletotrichum orbiculare (strain 104-T / ATCC 96160 / CBS 514.97 / LARS 414 / MAFF 240422) TaxID=1213857 RepID=A0A484FYA2_COLOR|nr:hypothetical protein Cob_v004189 [Colletotrichum orbiculare MAFF 240422]
MRPQVGKGTAAAPFTELSSPKLLHLVTCQPTSEEQRARVVRNHMGVAGGVDAHAVSKSFPSVRLGVAEFDSYTRGVVSRPSRPTTRHLHLQLLSKA